MSTWHPTSKAGRKSSGINNLVWIGKAVSHAAKLSDLGNKNGIEPIVMNSLFYDNFLKAGRNNQVEDYKKWFTSKTDSNLGTYYYGTVVKSEFNNWIESGMQE